MRFSDRQVLLLLHQNLKNPNVSQKSMSPKLWKPQKLSIKRSQRPKLLTQLLGLPFLIWRPRSQIGILGTNLLSWLLLQIKLRNPKPQASLPTLMFLYTKAQMQQKHLIHSTAQEIWRFREARVHLPLGVEMRLGKAMTSPTNVVFVRQNLDCLIANTIAGNGKLAIYLIIASHIF
jgi:hypothetical protein